MITKVLITLLAGLLVLLCLPFFQLPWLFDNLSNFTVFWAVCFLIFACFHKILAKKTKRILFSCFALLVSIHTYQFISPHALLSEAAASKNLSASYRLSQANLSYYNPELNHFVTKLTEDERDIMVFFEFNRTNKQLFNEIDPKLNSYGINEENVSSHGMAVMTKLDIISANQLHFEKPNSAIISLILFDAKVGKKFRLIVLHPPSPRTEQTWARRNETLKQLQLLAKQDSQMPSIIVGDINVSPWSAYFPDLSDYTPCYYGQGYFSSWSLQGYGDLGLFSTQIDHCFYSKAWQLSNYKQVPIVGSDHQALMYELALADK